MLFIGTVAYNLETAAILRHHHRLLPLGEKLHCWAKRFLAPSAHADREQDRLIQVVQRLHLPLHGMHQRPRHRSRPRRTSLALTAECRGQAGGDYEQVILGFNLRHHLHSL